MKAGTTTNFRTVSEDIEIVDNFCLLESAVSIKKYLAINLMQITTW